MGFEEILIWTPDGWVRISIWVLKQVKGNTCSKISATMIQVAWKLKVEINIYKF